MNWLTFRCLRAIPFGRDYGKWGTIPLVPEK